MFLLAICLFIILVPKASNYTHFVQIFLSDRDGFVCSGSLIYGLCLR